MRVDSMLFFFTINPLAESEDIVTLKNFVLTNVKPSY